MPEKKSVVNAKHQTLSASIPRGYVSQNTSIRIYFSLKNLRAF
jgi:hypothetical protein